MGAPDARAPEEVLQVELLDAVTPARELLAIVTLAEPIRRRRLNARSTSAVPHAGAHRAAWAGGAGSFEFSSGELVRAWVDVWDASTPLGAQEGFLGKVDLPLDTTRAGVPHLVQRQLLHGGQLRVRLSRLGLRAVRAGVAVDGHRIEARDR